MGILLLIIGVILFVGLVVVHELGHFWVARRNGVEAEEFGIGFPPRIWARTVGKGKKKFEFSVNLLPIGGFVKLKGEHDNDSEPGSFGAASFKSKAKIMLAGVWVNLLVALALFTVLAWVGMPKLVDNQFAIKSDSKVLTNKVLVGFIEPNSPAAKAGLHERDHLIAIEEPSTIQYLDKTGEKVLFEEPSPDKDVSKMTITSASQLPELTEQRAGKTVKFVYERDGRQHSASVTLRSKNEVEASRKTNEPKGYLGVSPTEYTLTRATWSAPIVAAGTATQFTVLTFQGLGDALSNLFHGQAAKASEKVSGPVGIFVVLKAGSLLGYQFMLLIIAIISLTLAIMNVLPIPALDGGRLYVMGLSRLLKKPLTQKAEEWIYGSSYLFLLGLIVLITVVDVKRYF